MPQRETLQVVGYTELMRGLQLADRETKRNIRSTFRTVAEPIRIGAAQLIVGKNARTAAGYKIRVRQKGVAVEQSLRKTTGKHPQWGGYQMRHALLPALAANARRTEAAFERALDEVCNQFNRG